MPPDRITDLARRVTPGTRTGRGLGTGSVARCPRNQYPPMSIPTTGTTRPAVGVTPVASVVASTGPTMNTTSSSADSSEYAVCSSRASATTADHRARTRAPKLPIVAPVTTASR